MSNTSLFALHDDVSNLSSDNVRERNVQAFYDEHANAATTVRNFKWVVAALLLVVGVAAWADENNIPEVKGRIPSVGTEATGRWVTSPDTSGRAADRAVTKFIDGPTGFVFVYTAEGWKFVPGSARAN